MASNFPGGLGGKDPLAMWETWVQSLAQCKEPAKAGDTRNRFNPWVKEDPLEQEMATHSSILAWKIPWTEEPGCLQSMGLQRVRHD